MEPVMVSGSNDAFGSAEAITPGRIKGFHVDDEMDYYSFTIAEPTVGLITNVGSAHIEHLGSREEIASLLGSIDCSGSIK